MPVDHVVRLPWGRLHVRVAGGGPAVVALHGLGGSCRYWDGLAAATGGRLTVIAPDLAGFGHSDMPAAVPYDRAFHLANLDAAVDDLGLTEPVILTGHSMGAVLAALWAARHPARVAGLALVAAPYPHALAPGTPRRYATVRARAALRLLRPLVPALSPVVARGRFPRPVVADYLRHTPRSYTLTADALLWDASAADDLAPLATLPAERLLLLFAPDDRTIAPDSLARWRGLLPQAPVHLAAGGHQLLLHTAYAPLAAWLRSRTEAAATAAPTRSRPDSS